VKSLSKLCLLTCGMGILISGCANKTAMTNVQLDSSADQELKVQIINTQGEPIGYALLSESAEGVKINVQVSKLPPGLHGIHFHEKGSCEPPDFTSAGAHFNPYGKQHGLNNPQGYHSGDLPNLVVDEQGKANTAFVTQAVTLKQGKLTSLRKDGGTSLIIHEKVDDLKTDPSGNSGNRIACGVVK
jgi:Cu-Zn family superoxide dismutase